MELEFSLNPTLALICKVSSVVELSIVILSQTSLSGNALGFSQPFVELSSQLIWNLVTLG